MNKEDELGNCCPITKWTPLVRKHAKNECFSQLVDNFMYTVHIIFYGESLPRIFQIVNPCYS